jgi:hypothetical protein
MVPGLLTVGNQPKESNDEVHCGVLRNGLDVCGGVL